MLWVAIGLILAGCSAEIPHITSTPTQIDGTLRPYPSPTTTATPVPTDYVTPTSSPTVTSTPTPVFYEVQSEDDMYSIAFRYGIEPAALMTANPTVNPRMMSVGMTLVIPITPSPPPTATAIIEQSPTSTGSTEDLLLPDCFPDAQGGLWCFVLVESETDQSRENISALVTLDGGDAPRQEVAIAPLNLLPAGKSIPLTVYFTPPIPANFSVIAEIDFWLPVMPGDDRYVPVVLEAPSISISANGRVARVHGDLQLPADQNNAAYVWVNAAAFDVDGRVVGVRRWESKGGLAAGEEIAFELFVYSLGGEIDRVDLLVEARGLIQATTEP